MTTSGFRNSGSSTRRSSDPAVKQYWMRSVISYIIDLIYIHRIIISICRQYGILRFFGKTFLQKLSFMSSRYLEYFVKYYAFVN